MIAIVILSLPILCLLVSIICCIICIRVARRGGKKIKHEARDYRKEDVQMSNFKNNFKNN